MFTANSMNCLTEALGLALPGNGTTLATHTARRDAVRAAGATVVDADPGATTTRTTPRCCPRAIANRAAFGNAMAMDIAMGGSTNTILHLLAAAHEAELDFTLDDIDRISRSMPCLTQGRAERRVPGRGRAPGRRHPRHPRRTRPRRAARPGRAAGPRATSLRGWLDDWDVRGGRPRPSAVELFHAAPGGVRSATAFSQSQRWESLDLDAENGCIRDVAHAYATDGGLAVLRGNLSVDGCVVKTAGRRPVDPASSRDRPWSSSPRRTRSRRS